MVRLGRYGLLWRIDTIAQEKEVRINGEIVAQEVRLVGVEGEPLGVVRLIEALRQAEEAEVDLVEIAPNANPPVCRLMDFGKFKYRESKRQHEAKVKQKQIQVKEIKFRPGTDDGDYAIKVRNLIRFLSEGDKTKVTLRFRGREMTHQELGYNLLKRVESDLMAYGVVEQFPKMEGRQMVMVLAPRKKEVGSKSAKTEKNKVEAAPTVG
ncbi:MAG: translation initiation factor IF-3 [Betaproteobacteria bacterium]|jgi:bacterial translation initiation factor 3 (bIF-3)|nr:translation initiation factor IF-3 [Betaproteobacteria bacterium]